MLIAKHLQPGWNGEQIDLFDDAGVTSNAKQDTCLEAARTEIWAGIKQFAVYNTTTNVFDYTNKIAGTRSEGLLKGYCLSLTRWYAYMNSQQATIPQNVADEAVRIRLILKEGINLPDIQFLKSIGEEPDGILQVYKKPTTYTSTDLQDW